MKRQKVSKDCKHDFHDGAVNCYLCDKHVDEIYFEEKNIKWQKLYREGWIEGQNSMIKELLK